MLEDEIYRQSVQQGREKASKYSARTRCEINAFCKIWSELKTTSRTRDDRREKQMSVTEEEELEMTFTAPAPVKVQREQPLERQMPLTLVLPGKGA